MGELGFWRAEGALRGFLGGANGAQQEAAAPPPKRRKVKKPKAKAAEAEAADVTKAVRKDAVEEAAVPERSESGACSLKRPALSPVTVPIVKQRSQSGLPSLDVRVPRSFVRAVPK
jgi:hypothetical protein